MWMRLSPRHRVAVVIVGGLALWVLTSYLVGEHRSGGFWSCWPVGAEYVIQPC